MRRRWATRWPTCSATSDEKKEEEGGEPGGSDTKTASDYIKDAQEAYQNAQEALKEGDWAKYGKYMKQLEEALEKLA